MRRSAVFLILCVLALITAVTLLRAAAAITAPGIDVEADPANEALIRRYYDAVNDAIRTGDLTPIDAVVSPDMVIHRASHGAEPRLVTFRETLGTLHATQPKFWIEVEDVIADGDKVMSRVVFHGSEPTALVAMPGPSTIDWSPNDYFFVRAGQIVEQWGATANLSVPHSIAQASVELPRMGAGLVAMSHLNFAPGANVPMLVTPGPVILTVDNGTLAVHLHGTATVIRTTPPGMPRPMEEVALGSDVALTAGDQLVIRAGVSYSVQNDGGAEADVLAIGFIPVSTVSARASPQFLSAGVTPVMPLGVAMFTPGDGDLLHAEWPEGVRARLIAAQSPVAIPADAATVMLQRVALAPGTSVNLPPADLELLALETGEGLLSTESGTLHDWLTESGPLADGGMAVSRNNGEPLLTARSNATVDGAGFLLSNHGGGPTQVLVLTIHWADSRSTFAA